MNELAGDLRKNIWRMLIVVLVLIIAWIVFCRLFIEPPLIRKLKHTTWKTVTVSFFTLEDAKTLKHRVVIDDPLTVYQLQSRFAVHSWEHATLHTLSWWNRIHIQYDNNSDKGEMMVACDNNSYCLYAPRRNAITLSIAPAFYHYLLATIRDKYGNNAYLLPDDERHRLHWNEWVMEKQETLLEPSDSSWCEVQHDSQTINQYYSNNSNSLRNE